MDKLYIIYNSRTNLIEYVRAANIDEAIMFGRSRKIFTIEDINNIDVVMHEFEVSQANINVKEYIFNTKVNWYETS